MLDTVGPELQVINKTEKSISLQEDAIVVLTPNQDLEATSELLPINFTGLSKVSTSYCCYFHEVCLVVRVIMSSMLFSLALLVGFSVGS